MTTHRHGRGRRCDPRSLGRLAGGVSVLVGVGGCAGPAPPPGLVTRAELPCDELRLERFDPGLPVLSRRWLPSAERGTTTEEQHVVTRRCDDHESDERCRERAEREARSGATGPVSLSTRVAADDYRLLAVLEVDGAREAHAFDSQEALVAAVAGLRAAGRQVGVLELRPEPREGASRHAVVRVTVTQEARRVEALRAELLVASAGDEDAAFARVRGEAARAGVQIGRWEPLEAARIRLEVGCSRIAPRP